MDITFDPAKNALNIAARGLSFEGVANFDFETALIWVDDRRIYPEVRYSALGLIARRVHAVVFTETATGIRVISFRKASREERETYDAWLASAEDLLLSALSEETRFEALTAALEAFAGPSAPAAPPPSTALPEITGKRPSPPHWGDPAAALRKASREARSLSKHRRPIPPPGAGSIGRAH